MLRHGCLYAVSLAGAVLMCVCCCGDRACRALGCVSTLHPALPHDTNKQQTNTIITTTRKHKRTTTGGRPHRPRARPHQHRPLLRARRVCAAGRRTRQGGRSALPCVWCRGGGGGGVAVVGGGGLFFSRRAQSINKKTRCRAAGAARRPTRSPSTRRRGRSTRSPPTTRSATCSCTARTASTAPVRAVFCVWRRRVVFLCVEGVCVLPRGRRRRRWQYDESATETNQHLLNKKQHTPPTTTIRLRHRQRAHAPHGGQGHVRRARAAQPRRPLLHLTR